MPCDPIFNKGGLREGFVGCLGRLEDPRCRWSIRGPRGCWRPQPDIQLRKDGLRIVRNKSRPPKTPKNIFLGESPAEGGLECEKELGLGDVRNPGLDEERDF